MNDQNVSTKSNTVTGSSKKDNKGLIVLIALLILVVAGMAVYILKSRNDKSESAYSGNVSIATDATGDQPDIMKELSGRYVVFAGIDDATFRKGDIMRLENMAEHEGMYMKYVITNAKTGELIKETELIPAGLHVDWVVSDNLETGEYPLNFKEIPYYPTGDGDYMELTTGNNLATFTIQ